MNRSFLSFFPFITVPAVLLLTCGIAAAHPHEWYDVNVVADLGNGRNELVLDVQLQPDAFTNVTLHQNADINRDGRITDAEIVTLRDLYRSNWEKADWFTHVLLNGDACRPVRIHDVQLYRGTDEYSESVFTVRLLVHVPIDRHKEYNTVNLMFFDVSNYTALSLSSRNVQLRADPRRVEITAISQSRKAEVRLLYRLLPEPAPDADGGDAPRAANASSGNADAGPTTASVIVHIEDTGNGPELTLMERFAEWARETSQFVEGKLRELKTGADLTLLLMLMGSVALWGFLHALGPGHGKGLIAAYLAQRDGRFLDVLKLGFLIAYVHTGASVLLIGIVKLFADLVIGAGGQKAFMDSAQGWIGIGCFSLVVVMGLRMLIKRMTEHDHHHDEIQSTELRKIAIFYGMVPCPAAFMLMTFALGADMFHIGILLVAAQAFGIALVLVGVGATVLWSRRGLTGAFRPHESSPVPALAGIPAAAAAAVADDRFTREDEIEWLDDDPADDPAPADDDEATHEDQIEWLDDDDKRAAIPARLDTPSYAPAAPAGFGHTAADAADDSHDDHDHDELPFAIRTVENLLGYGGAIAMVILGSALVWYHGHWVLGIF